MLGTTVVVDAVVHPYDLGPANRIPEGREQLEALHPYHVLCSGPDRPEFVLRPDEFLVDFDPEAVAHALFAESPVDLALIHSLPNLGFTKGGITDPARMAELRDRYPDRFLLYGTVDTPITDVAIAELERQVRDYRIDGVKLYPCFFYDGTAKGWRLDGQDYAAPLLEAAIGLGIRNVAIHKTIPVQPAPDDCFRVEDLDGALERFSQLNIAMVHAGVAFVPETCRLLSAHPNLYANLESTFSYLLGKPRRFAETLGTLLAACGPRQLLFGSGCNLAHPRPVLEAFAAFEMPRDLVEDQGLPDLTEEDKVLILGGNALRLHGLDPDTVRRQTAGDAFEKLKADGYPEPWSLVRQATP